MIADSSFPQQRVPPVNVNRYTSDSRGILNTQYLAVDSPEIVVQFTDGTGSCGSLPADLPLEEHRGPTLLVCILGFSIGPPMVS